MKSKTLVRRSKMALNNLKFVNTYNKKKLICNYPPLTLFIEPINICNLKCKMCPQSGIMERKKGMMKIDTYKKIIDECHPYINNLYLLFIGEPLLHPQIFDMIKYAKRFGIIVGIATNATLLNENMSKKIIESGLDNIKFSFDGVNKDVYENIRINANFEKTLENIVNFLDIKNIMKRNKPFTVLEIIKMDDTADKIQGFVERFRNLEINMISIKSYINWCGTLENSESGKNDNYRICSMPWRMMTVCWDGSVIPCCRDFDAKYTIGMVPKDRLIDIWNNKKMLHIRKRLVHKKHKDIDICRDCNIFWDHTENPKTSVVRELFKIAFRK
jgi:radical SAM protein with 4Fe4S-binding SPASM domain